MKLSLSFGSETDSILRRIHLVAVLVLVGATLFKKPI